jgi:hypothetical protein
MKKADREALEAVTVYRVERDKLEGKYKITKRIDGDLDGIFHVTLTWYPHCEGEMPKVMWCDCTGFQCQKFAHIDHKHIKLVIDYQEEGEPTYAEYHIFGTGAKAKIKHIMTVWEDEDL